MPLPPQYVWGIDPGCQGGLVVLSRDRTYCFCTSFSRLTDKGLAEIFFDQGLLPSYVFFEKVGAMPKDRPKSAFAFGHATGFLKALLVANGVPYEEVAPQVWQRKMALGGKWENRKHAHKNKAEKIFPGANITLENCDAFLIAEYGYRTLWR